jgi:hypothetical protein
MKGARELVSDPAARANMILLLLGWLIGRRGKMKDAAGSSSIPAPNQLIKSQKG